MSEIMATFREDLGLVLIDEGQPDIRTKAEEIRAYLDGIDVHVMTMANLEAVAPLPPDAAQQIAASVNHKPKRRRRRRRRHSPPNTTYSWPGRYAQPRMSRKGNK